MSRGPKAKTPAIAAAETETPAVVADTARTYVRNPASHFTVTSVQHVTEAELKEGLRRALAVQHAAIEAFIEAKLAEGLTLEEINAFSSVQMQVMPSIIDHKGRLKFEAPYKIIEPDD